MLRKKILTFLLLMALPAITLAQETPVFPDVPLTHKNAYAIKVLKEAGIVSGYMDGTFRPDNSVSRAEAVAIMLKAVGITAARTEAKLPFTDVPEDSWFFPMIQKGVALKKLKGYEDKTFRPNNPVTLPESLALALGFYNINTKNIAIDARIYDGLATDEWYSKFAQYAKDKNLIEPNNEGHIDTISPLTRAALAEIIFRMRIVQQTSKSFDITSGWVTTEYIENFWKLRHPSDWQIFKGSQNSVLWKSAGHKIFFARVWPDSARLSISLVPNSDGITAAQYFANFKKTYTAAYPDLKISFAETTLGNRPALTIEIPDRRITDTVIVLPTRDFLIFYSEYGEAPIGEFLKKQLEKIVLSYQYVAPPPVPPPPPLPPLEERMETLRENILVAEKWPEISPLFPDKKLIHTDAIGIGTGPVDYYYSQEAAHTIKLERNSGTVLNIKENETTNF